MPGSAAERATPAVVLRICQQRAQQFDAVAVQQNLLRARQYAMHGDGGTIGTAVQCGRRDSIGDGGPLFQLQAARQHPLRPGQDHLDFDHRSALVGDADEIVDHAIGQPLEADRQRRTEQARAGFELQGQGDLAGILGQRMEFPAAVQLLERAIAQLHINAVRALQGVFGLEPGTERAQAQVQSRHQAVLALLKDLGSRAPAETARIGLDIIDQVEHARGRMFDQGAAADSRHEYRTFRQSTGRARIGDNTEMSKNSGKDKAKSATANKTIALNKRARHEYHIEERFEAGLALQGWEVKSIRAGRGNIIDAYAYVKRGEIYLIGAQITPLIQASTHVVANDRRERKLLLHRSEIDKLIGKVERDGYTIVPTAMYWSKNKIKLEVALAKGKQTHDKRDAAKDRDWAIEKQRVMRRGNRDA